LRRGWLKEVALSRAGQTALVCFKIGTTDLVTTAIYPSGAIFSAFKSAVPAIHSSAVLKLGEAVRGISLGPHRISAIICRRMQNDRNALLFTWQHPWKEIESG